MLFRSVVFSNDLKEQLQEVITKLHLYCQKSKMFTRCVVCNRILISVEKNAIKGNVPEYAFAAYTEFKQCAACGRIYWPGSHWGQINKVISRIYPGLRG